MQNSENNETAYVDVKNFNFIATLHHIYPLVLNKILSIQESSSCQFRDRIVAYWA